MSTKPMLALAAAAALLAGCATGPYYDNYNYAYGDGSYYGQPTDNYYYPPSGPVYRYGPAYYPSPYYSPYYVAPSVGFGITYSSRGHRHY